MSPKTSHYALHFDLKNYAFALSYEKFVSLDRSEDFEITKLRHVNVRFTQKNMTDAVLEDPMQLYIFNTPDKKKAKLGSKSWWAKTQRISMHYCIASKRKIALTIHDGIAVVVASYAANSQQGRKRRLDRIADRLNSPIRKITWYLQSPEQRTRFKELADSMNKLVSTLGKDAKDMVYLDLLATAPAFQRRGYGGALVEAINDIADSEGRRVYLISSNIDNTEFYNSHGFETTATAALGENNPTWDKKPVVISLMVRGAGEKMV